MKYSIITVNYNNREGLRHTIESVIRQTFRDFEFIVIDGGSTDGSVDTLKAYDKDITFWESEPDGGIYQGMNKGIAHATGEYINFMNSGDCFYDSRTLEQVDSYASDADIITGRDYHYSMEKQAGHASMLPTRLSMITFFNATLDHQSSFIRRTLFESSPYREDYRMVSDWIFFTQKIVSEGKRVQLIPLIVCRREEGGVSDQQHERNRTEINRWLHEFLPQGIYDDYATLSKLDKTSLYRLFNICENDKQRKALVWCIKLIHKVANINFISRRYENT